MAAQQEPPTMTLSEILSDLVSLRVCVSTAPIVTSPSSPVPSHKPLLTYLQDPAAALALVSARPASSNSNPHAQATEANDDNDNDLKRAKDLLKLHYDVKEAHKRGQLSRGLEEARRDVGRAVGTG